MRSVALFFFLASPVFAVSPPGPPPWQCYVAGACEGENCVWIPAMPLGLKLIETRDNIFRVEGHDGDDRTALRGDDPAQALKLVSDGMPETISLYLRPSDKVADAHGFELYSIGRRGTGEHVWSKSHALIACNSIR